MHGPLMTARQVADTVCRAGAINGRADQESLYQTVRNCVDRLPHVSAKGFGPGHPARLYGLEAAVSAACAAPLHEIGLARRQCADTAANLFTSNAAGRMIAEAATARKILLHVAASVRRGMIEGATWVEIDGERIHVVRPVERVRAIVAAAVPCHDIVRALASA